MGGNKRGKGRDKPDLQGKGIVESEMPGKDMQEAPDKWLYEYFVVRYMPRPERGEFLNIGLVMLCKRQKWLKGKISLDERKLKNFHSDVNMEHLLLQSALFERTDVPEAHLPVEEKYRWLGAEKSGCIRVSPSHPGIIPSHPEINPSTASINPSTSGIQPSTASINPSTSGIQPSTASINPSTSGISTSTASITSSSEKIIGEKSLEKAMEPENTLEEEFNRLFTLLVR